MDWKGKINFEILPQILGTNLLSKLSNEWFSLTEKTSPVNEDLVLLEDSQDGYSKKKVKVSNIKSVFGQNYQRQQNFTQTSTTAEDQIRVTLTTGALTGTYRIGWGCYLWANNKPCIARIYNFTDASQLMSVQVKAVDDNPSADTFAGGSVHITLTGSSKVLQLRYGNIATKTDLIYILNAWIEFWRVS